ncbi:hypothetical protein NC661_18050 [Aquibacillus koreensis]|uniref:Uncharacterized protein n=1 Tax=Aquibacillus koreensis TaxID=279446 RepID=A0A9X3WQ65_9BACI|nr:hypothetical protein [Aquibacillus koreensis]MCT2535421.1 hypothetical protein [Aquibacillus koreensis]MDC3422256.1 hypothetical protein [Aquibacillus koreensis]
MQVFSTFENNAFTELAITTLEKKGIKKEQIFIVPLDNRQESPKLFDTLHRSDGTTFIDIGLALATAFSVIGASIGFKFAWGPIYWGLIGAFLGFLLGFIIRLFTEVILKKKKRKLKGKHSEVIVIVECEKRFAELVENILWAHYAIGVAKVISGAE